MRDLALIGFMLALMALGFKRPFLFTLTYVYIDTVSPQRLSYYLLNGAPISMIVAGFAIAGWLLFDRKEGMRPTARQALMLILILYTAMTTMHAAVPLAAAEKWEWAWKAIAFAIFLPFTLRTKLRIEAVILFLVLSCAAIVIVGGIKTVLSGGGYGVLNLMVDNNSGLFESSTIATVSIAIIPLILWLARFGTIFVPDWRVKLFAAALIFACLLMPIGTEARTGLVCIGVLAVLMLRDVKRRFLYLAGAALLGMAAVPFLPSSFTSRMTTIQGYQADSSASTRLAVWKWTWDYAQQNPYGGGFGAYQQNQIVVQTVDSRTAGGVQVVSAQMSTDAGRAYHSSYFEMLGEQGFPGLILFLVIHAIGLVRMEVIRRRYRRVAGDLAWVAPLATSLQHFHIIVLVGSVFVAIAYQPFPWLVFAVQIGFDTWVGQQERKTRPARPAFGAAAPATA
ncbi:MAG: putative O-glycosylation ligase, exosortase A system-associated [Pseudomonadota bacterium]|nr:putative O-glycosylation ligase, exosortase A system-associated [Pseudomonadota bacterium]